jgi:lipid-A-disaccharide synthase
MVCAADPSGDQHAAKVFAELKKTNPDLQIWGVGGPELAKDGAELFYRSENLSVIGIFGAIEKLPMAAAMRAKLLKEMAVRRPECVVLVDFGGFNLNLAVALHKRFPDTPVIYFISPQVWGSRPWRINVIKQCCSKALVIFPFEQELYRRNGIDAHFVGHPITERFADMDLGELRRQFCQKYSLNPDKPIIGIFPGSRAGEVHNFMPMIMQAISWLHRLRPEIQFAMSQANPRTAGLIIDGIAKEGGQALIGTTLKLTNSEDNQGLMAASDLLWTKSGTTTLEAAMMEKPMLVFYRGDWLSYIIFMLFKRVKYVALPNLLAGKMLVPELIQLDCRAEQLVRYTRDWLDVPAARADIAEGLRGIKSYLSQGNFAANTAAELQKTLTAGKRMG